MKIFESFKEIAKEEGTIEKIDNTYYFFGSELATLRLYRRYAAVLEVNKLNHAYSSNLKTWFFSLTF